MWISGDWEKVITREQRSEEYLHETVITIYNAIKNLGGGLR